MFKRKTSYFVSDIDQYLAEIRQQVNRTESQRKEQKKYEKINYLRDHAVVKEEQPEYWDNF